MKTKIIKYITGVLLAGLIAGCQKDEIPYYDSTYNAVRFPASSLSSSEPTGYDSSSGVFRLNYSFVEDPFAGHAMYDIPLVLAGNPAGHDRQVSYMIDAELSSAPAGSYEIQEAVIPSGSFNGYIRIKLYNAEELNEETYELHITLVESDGLSPAQAKYTSAVMSWNNMIPTPVVNNQIRSYNMLVAGASNYISTSIAWYSPNALKAIVDALGWNDWDDYDVRGSRYNSDGYKYLPVYSFMYGDYSYKSYAAKLAVYIKAYNEAHPEAPLLHNAGELKGEPVEARKY